MIPSHRATQHRVRAIVALLALALAAFVLAACGGSGGGGGGDDARSLLEQTFTGTHKIDSGTVDAKLAFAAKGDPSLKGPIRLTVSGPFQRVGDGLPKFDLALDLSAQGQGLQAGATSTGDRLFVNFGGTSYEVPARMLRQLRTTFGDAKGDGKGLDLGGLHLQPLDWLKDPTVEGDATVGGEQTTHVGAQLDVKAFLDDVEKLLGEVKRKGIGGAAAKQIPSRIPAKDRKQIEDAVTRSQIDVYTGKDDHTLRRLAVKLALTLPKDANGPSSATVDFDLRLLELNEPQKVTAPKTSRPLDELLSQLQGFLGGALSGASGSGGGSAQTDAYIQCLQDAGADVAKAQQCASLLAG